MTACTNKARGAVVAALAGVLALGAVPAVALATGTADAQVDLLVNEGEDSFANSTVSLTGLSTDANGDYYTTASGGGFSVSAIKITSVKLKGTNVFLSPSDYSWEVYKADESGNPILSEQYGDKISEPGDYVIVITCEKAEYKDETKNVEFAVKPAEFTGVTFTPYEVHEDDLTYKSDTSFMYTGSEIKVGAINNSTLVEGYDYEVKVVKDGGQVTDPAVNVEDAGKYFVVIEGKGQYAGSYATSSVIDVQAFDMAGAEITVDDQTGAAPEHPTKVVYNDKTNAANPYNGTELDPSLVTIACDGVWGSNGNAAYKFNASYADKDNIQNAYNGQVTVNKVGALASFEYDGAEIVPGTTYTVDLSKDQVFDIHDIAVYAGDNLLERGPNEDFTIDVTDATGADGWSALFGSDTGHNNAVGTYEVTVRTQPGLAGTSNLKGGYEVGGSVTFTVRVIEGTIDADAQVYVSMGTDIVTSYTKQYDNQAVKPSDFNVKVYDAKGNDITSDVSIQKTLIDSNNNDISTRGAIDAGEYVLKITCNNGYDLTGTTEVPVTITKVDLTQLKVGALESWSGAEYLPMAGGSMKAGEDNPAVADMVSSRAYSTIASFKPQFMKDGKWADVSVANCYVNPEAWFSVEKWDADKGEWVKQSADYCKTAGKYRLVLRGNEQFAKNYDLADETNNTTTVEFLVVDKSQLEFTDVKPGDNFFNCIDWMFDRGLVKGYANTTVYGQDHQISRADVVVILYRMAKGTPHYNVDLGYSETQGWVTGFDDVDGNMYYAKAIGWASKLGIVHGYDDGNFRPEQSVTREELATMLANFAKNVYDEEVTLDEDALETMPDAGSVSTFAKKAVSWCVANDLMGNGGFINPTGNITRGETAAMDYNYLTKMVGVE